MSPSLGPAPFEAALQIEMVEDTDEKHGHGVLLSRDPWQGDNVWLEWLRDETALEVF